MARVPTIQPFQERTGVSRQVDFSPLARTAGDFGASAGRQLQQAGDALSNIALEQQRKLDDAALKEADTAFITAKTDLFNNPQTGYFTQRGKNAIDGYGSTLDALDEQVTAIRNDLKPHLQGKFDTLAATRRAAAVNSMSSHRLREQTRYEDETSEARLEASLTDAVANWNDEGVRRQAFTSAGDELEDLAERKGWSTEVLAERQKAFSSSVHAGTLDQIIPVSTRQAQAYLDRNRDSMDAKAILAAERSIDVEQRRRLAEARRGQAQAQAQSQAALSVAVLEGRAGAEDINDAYESGTITPAAWASLRARHATAAEKRAKEAEVFEIVAAGGPLDPRDSDHREAVDTVFKSAGGIDGLVGRDPETASSVASLAGSTGIVVPTAQSYIRGALASGDDQSRQYAYDLIARLDEQAPAALDRAFDAQELTEANHYIKLTRAGVSDTQAMEALEAGRAMDQATRDARRKEGAKAFEDVDVEDAFFDPSSLPFDQGSLPDYAPLADQIREDARAVFVDAFTRTGDEDVARDIARKTLQKTYGVSEVAGSGTVMQYPPERFYSIPGIENDWMREQLLEDVKSVSPDVVPEHIELVPTPRTAADVRSGQPPRYQVLVQDENGIYEPVLSEDGQAMDYRFDPSRVIQERADQLAADREDFLERERNAPHTLLRNLFGIGTEAAETVEETVRPPELGLGVGTAN